MTVAVWRWVGLSLALAGPGVIALPWTWSTPNNLSLRASAPWLGVFAALLAVVALIAFCGEGLGWADIGLGRVSWVSPLYGVALALFFTFVFAPAASAAASGAPD